MTSSPARRAFDHNPAGQAFRLKKTGAANEDESGRAFCDEGLMSGCSVPLVVPGESVGIHIGSFQEAAFTKADLELLTQIAGQVAIAVQNAMSFKQIEELKNRLAEEKLYLEDEIRNEYFDEIVGESKPLKQVLEQIQTVAETDATVLILGETGSGKELIARALHNQSQGQRPVLPAEVIPIRVPPLRERADDIPRLVRHFVGKYAKQLNRDIESIPAPTMRALQQWALAGQHSRIGKFHGTRRDPDARLGAQRAGSGIGGHAAEFHGHPGGLRTRAHPEDSQTDQGRPQRADRRRGEARHLQTRLAPRTTKRKRTQEAQKAHDFCAFCASCVPS